ncbi:MAG: cupin domain-containing protein [Chloroflexi bacterium]|nr:cupin domain-containing protein [Chloroflexota bacterium]
MLPITKLDQARAQLDTTSSFEGTVRKHMLVGAGQSQELELLAVYFSAGARTRPHIHEKDQVLHFIQGRGIVATDTEKKVCGAGDIVTVPGGVWHWHGATREDAMCHISIRQPGKTNWDVESKNWAEY